MSEFLGITVSEFFDFEVENPQKLHNINLLLKKLDDKQLEVVETVIKALIE